jgi:amidase
MPHRPDLDLDRDPDATDLSAAIHARRVSCREVMAATLERIAALNPRFGAIVNLAPAEGLLAEADARDVELARGASRGWLHGIPQAIKDTGHALGFPTTWGCTRLANAHPAHDSLYVARLKAAGAIVIGKTNMPEFGLGSHTFNTLFGATRNAFAPERSAGGSSGGAAVALALRLLPVADGSDFMGSLRNPAAWANLFGLRPAQGRVPGWPKPDVWTAQLATDGPMARSVRDLARMLGTMAGFDARVPLSLASEPADAFVPPPAAAEAGLRGVRIGWLGDLGGHLPVEPGLLEVNEAALAVMEGAGARIEPAAPGFDAEAVWRAWLVWRRALVAPSVAAVLGPPGTAAHAAARAELKAEALWEHDTAQGLLFDDFFAASRARSVFVEAFLRHFERFDLLALPATQVWPFDVHERWPHAIAGRAMDTYHRWMECTLYATFAGLPAASVPAGFDTATGRLPVGVQLIGRPRGESALLAAMAAYEARSAALLARRPGDVAAPAPG